MALWSVPSPFDCIGGGRWRIVLWQSCRIAPSSLGKPQLGLSSRPFNSLISNNGAGGTFGVMGNERRGIWPCVRLDRSRNTREVIRFSGFFRDDFVMKENPFQFELHRSYFESCLSSRLLTTSKLNEYTEQELSSNMVLFD